MPRINAKDADQNPKICLIRAIRENPRLIFPLDLRLNYEQGGEGPVPPATTLSYWGEDSFTYDLDQADPQESLPGDFPSQGEATELNRLLQPHR